MYNEDYFKQVLGNNYNSNDLYTPTYQPEYKKIKEIDNDNIHEEIQTVKPKEKDSGIEKVKDFVEKVGDDFTKYYPDIYNIVVPVVDAVISKNKEFTITKDIIEAMTEEVYNIIEDEEEKKEEKDGNKTSQDSAVQVSTKPIRKPKNKTLCDLIKILLLEHLRPRHDNKPQNKPMPPRNHPFPEDIRL